MAVLVEDNGQGDATSSTGGPPPRAGGRGRSNMQRRAAAIGGEVRWQATPQGLQLRLWQPRWRQIA